MKRNLYILLALILVASFTIAAGGGGKNTVKLQGTIDEISDTDMTITVDVVYPEKYAGEIVVLVTNQTVIKECEGDFRISFSDLLEDHTVQVTGIFNGDVFVASRIIQDKALP